MHKFTIIASVEHNAEGDFIPSDIRNNALTLVRHDLAVTFGGYTETTVTGAEFKDGTHLHEEGHKWEIFTDKDLKSGEQAAKRVRRMLMQSSVIFTMDFVPHVHFVTDAFYIDEVGNV